MKYFLKNGEALRQKCLDMFGKDGKVKYQTMIGVIAKKKYTPDEAFARITKPKIKEVLQQNFNLIMAVKDDFKFTDKHSYHYYHNIAYRLGLSNICQAKKLIDLTKEAINEHYAKLGIERRIK